MAAVELVKRPELDPKMFEIAKIGLQEGLMLPEKPKRKGAARGAGQVESKYGVHAGNWVDNITPPAENEYRQTKPKSYLFMDNMKVDAFLEATQIARESGIRPYLTYRPYYSPGTNTGGKVQDYINRARERFNALLAKREIRELADEGKLWSKILNEVNIGTESFPEGRNGLAEAQDIYLTVLHTLRQEFGNAIKHASIAMTPGHDDAYFLGDDLNQMYVFHGAEGASPDVLEHILKKIITPSYAIPASIQRKIDAARQSRILNPMFRESDGHNFHIYAQNTQQIQGNLATWFLLRYKMFQFWLADIDKPQFVPEFDAGYDEPAKYGELFVWSMRNVIDPDRKIVRVNRWWSSQPGEGDPSWVKHESRDVGGNLKPHMFAIVEYRKNDTAPEPNPQPNPEPQPQPNPQPTPLPARVLDPRLPQLGVKVIDAVVQPGEKFWRVKEVLWENEQEAQGRIEIRIDLQDENGNRIVGGKVVVTNGGRKEVLIEEKRGEPYGGNFPMFAAGNAYSLEGIGLKTDKITGMGLGDIERRNMKIHTSYKVKLQRMTMPANVDPLEPILKKDGDANQKIRFNKNAALQKAIFRTGYVPNSPEYYVTHTNDIGVTQTWVAQRAEKIDTGDVKYFAAVVNDWTHIFWTNGAENTLAPVPDSPQG